MAELDGTLDWDDVAPRVLAQMRERNAWKETAEQAMRDRDFYRSVVTKIGEMFGDEAKTADDGTVMEDVLALKVPECVRRLREEIDAARQEAFRYGFKRDCDDSDPAEVEQADELISLVSWIAQAECEARAERDDALCRLRELETRFVPYAGCAGGDRLLTAAVPPELFDGVAVVDRTTAGQGAVVGHVTNPRRDADGKVVADLVDDQDGQSRLVGNVCLRRGSPIGHADGGK